ncbi:hypothetical protein Prudu_014214, partial [Prunus dulcis]
CKPKQKSKTRRLRLRLLLRLCLGLCSLWLSEDILYKAFGKASQLTSPMATEAPEQAPKLMESNLFQFPRLHHPAPQIQPSKECIQEDELRNLLAHKSEPIAYDGFEPSGRMHIAQGVMKTINVNKMTSAGCRVKIWIADWFAMLNNKMGGDLKKIETVGRYLIEIWRAAGMNLDNGKVEFLWSSKEINSKADEYWPRVMDIAQKNSVVRLWVEMSKRLTAAQILYPCMQCADIFFLKADICQLGMDQRKVNVLAREYCDDIKKKNKPIILSHHMLPGLQQGQEKMSKSDVSSSIFMEDEEAEVNLKIKKAYCPPNSALKKMAEIKLAADYESGELHPADLKSALSKALNKILEPVRSHFKNDKTAKQLLQSVKGQNDLNDSLK